MHSICRLTTHTSWAVYLLVVALGNVPAYTQQQNKFQLERPLAEDLELICETDPAPLSGAAQASTSSQILTSAEQQTILIEKLKRIDVNRNGQIDHRELKVLDYLTRKQLLIQFDSNLDHQLSPHELPQSEITNQTAYDPSFTTQPERQTPPQRESFQNLRRFGIGASQPPSIPRRQPFARAAQFGTTPNFTRRSIQVGSAQSSRGIGHSNFRATTTDIYWRAGTGSCQLRITSRP